MLGLIVSRSPVCAFGMMCEQDLSARSA